MTINPQYLSISDQVPSQCESTALRVSRGTNEWDPMWSKGPGEKKFLIFICSNITFCRPQWPRGLRLRSAAARLLRFWGSNPTGGVDVCLLCVLRFVRYKSMRRADHSSRVVLQTLVRRYVWSRNFVNEGGPGPLGAVAPKERKYYFLVQIKFRIKDLAL